MFPRNIIFQFFFFIHAVLLMTLPISGTNHGRKMKSQRKTTFLCSTWSCYKNFETLIVLQIAV